MIELAHQRSIEASPVEVWAVLADFEHLADWAPGVSHSSAMTPVPPGLGATRRVQAGPVTLVETITVWAPDRALAYELSGLPPIAGAASNRWTLAPNDSGTDVTLTIGIEPRAKPLSKIAARLVSRRIAVANRALLAALAAVVEPGRTES
jgi:carbon monoxide dehydrogenase subunit G